MRALSGGHFAPSSTHIPALKIGEFIRGARDVLESRTLLQPAKMIFGSTEGGNESNETFVVIIMYFVSLS